jgi:hypothetical protein
LRSTIGRASWPPRAGAALPFGLNCDAESTISMPSSPSALSQSSI